MPSALQIKLAAKLRPKPAPKPNWIRGNAAPLAIGGTAGAGGALGLKALLTPSAPKPAAAAAAATPPATTKPGETPPPAAAAGAEEPGMLDKAWNYTKENWMPMSGGAALGVGAAMLLRSLLSKDDE